MKTKIGILYATVDGQTLKISNVIKEILIEKGNEVELFPIKDFDKKVTDYDKFVIGASIRYGKHNSKIIRVGLTILLKVIQMVKNIIFEL